jgi:hypothetical protein
LNIHDYDRLVQGLWDQAPRVDRLQAESLQAWAEVLSSDVAWLLRADPKGEWFAGALETVVDGFWLWRTSLARTFGPNPAEVPRDLARRDLLVEAAKIEAAKRPAYTVGSDDVLANFKRVALRADIHPWQAWAVYFLKHVDALLTAATRADLPQAEPLVGRFADAINYLKLGAALAADESAWHQA